MRVLLAGLRYVHHVQTCSVLKKALEARGHEVDWELFALPTDGSYQLQILFNIFKEQSPMQKKILSKRLQTGAYDLLITEPPIFPACELHFETGIPWAIYSNLPIFYIDRTTPLHLQCTIPSFEVPMKKKNLQFIGPITSKPLFEPQFPDFWFDIKHSQRPIVHVTQGTVANDPVDLVFPTIAACDDGYLVLSKPLQHCWFMSFVDVFVTNGGYGGISAAIEAGTPIVVAGDTEDKPINGIAVERAGNGINIGTGKPTVRQLRDAIAEVAHNPRFKLRAMEMKAECEQYSIEQGIDSLERLAAPGRIAINA